MRDLSKRKLSRLSKSLEAAQAVFRAEVQKLADQIHVEILPYFKKHGMDFRAGNGTWCITRLDEEDGREILVDEDELPTNIRDLLMIFADHLGYVTQVERSSYTAPANQEIRGTKADGEDPNDVRG